MISSLVSMYFTKAMFLVMGIASDEKEEAMLKEQEQLQAKNNTQQQTEPKEREVLDAKAAKQEAANAFEASMQQERQGQGLRIG